MSKKLVWLSVLCLGSAAACGDDGGSAGADANPGADSSDVSTSSFVVRIENVSAGSALPTPLSPGVWATHTSAENLFESGAADRAEGLEAVAEDGNPATLASSLDGAVSMSGAFDTPDGASAPGPLLPGGAYEFTVTATPDAPLLSMATMFVQSNDVFIAPRPEGIELFDTDGDALAEMDITDQLMLWDVGTEANEAPGSGPNQAPRQSGADTGAAEGVVSAFANSTRALPAAQRLVTATVAESNGTYTITFENTSEQHGALPTPIAPVFWALHDATWSLFTEGEADDGTGLESLAEDGSPAALVATHMNAAGVGSAGAQPRTLETPGADGPAFPGDHYELEITPSADYPNLSVAAMVVQTNDAFLAFDAAGVALLDDSDAPRAAADVEADINAVLAVWDAGTETNQVPSVGADQAPRQGDANTGSDDVDDTVRRYSDSTNDLAGTGAGGFVAVSITHGTEALSFDIEIENTSDETVYPGALTPALWAAHDGDLALFADGQVASAGLERIAEDGDPSVLLAAVGADGAVDQSNVVGAAPIGPGESYQLTVTLDATNRYLSLVSMVVPSNDTFVALGANGVELIDSNGDRRSEQDIAGDIATLLGAWDAGTEANQSGAGGRDQAPRQAAADTGAGEGSGLVRAIDDPVWSYPAVGDVVVVTVRPAEERRRFERPERAVVRVTRLAPLVGVGTIRPHADRGAALRWHDRERRTAVVGELAHQWIGTSDARRAVHVVVAHSIGPLDVVLSAGWWARVRAAAAVERRPLVVGVVRDDRVRDGER
jgi:hypothetical protein